MRTRLSLAVMLVIGGLLGGSMPSSALDRPFATSRLVASTFRATVAAGEGGNSDPGGQFSKAQITAFRCQSSAGPAYGNPDGAMDISCNDSAYRQDFNPDNELAVAVNPKFPDHVLAGSNDYFYRFNNATGARQALVPTGFFTTFDGGQNWIDGQIPVRSGSGAGDPSPAFVGKLSSDSDAHGGWAMMAQLENAGGQGSAFVAQGDVSVSYSSDGGVTWSSPVTVFKGTGTGIGPANRAVFYDKEWLTVDNNVSSPYYGRAYLTTSRFLNGLQGSYAESAIYLAYSDDGGRSWSEPQEIDGSHPSCTFQSSGDANECDENQFSIPEVAANGDVFVHFANGQNEAAWESPLEFDDQIMVVKSTDGGQTFSDPTQVIQIEDGAGDTAYSVIGRQTVTGHQLRWTAVGNIAADPTDPDHVTVVFADNLATADSGPDGCTDLEVEAPDYNPCGIDTNTNVYRVDSTDGGITWGPRTTIDGSAGDQWFAWSDYAPDGTLAVAYDSNEGRGGDADLDDTFNHVLTTIASDGTVSREVLVPDGAGRTPTENIDISVTHWSGQYVPEPEWPRICGPDGYSDPPVTDAEGKDCNVFHGDYTGLAVDQEGGIHVAWTGLNRLATSAQVDPYTGGLHDGYAQDAMYAKR